MTTLNASYHRPPTAVAVIKVIMCEALRGSGTPEDPIRRVIQHWTLDGDFIMEYSPDSPEQQSARPERVITRRFNGLWLENNTRGAGK